MPQHRWRHNWPTTLDYEPKVLTLKIKAGKAFLILQLTCLTAVLYAADMEERAFTLTSTDRFDLIDGGNVRFQLLNDTVRTLETINQASSLGVTHIGRMHLKENVTALSALRGIADQVSRELNMNFAVIADSSTSKALRESELLLLYHPDVTLTLALIKSDQQDHYEIICTYALREKEPPASSTDDEATTENRQSTKTSSLPAQPEE